MQAYRLRKQGVMSIFALFISLKTKVVPFANLLVWPIKQWSMSDGLHRGFGWTFDLISLIWSCNSSGTSYCRLPVVHHAYTFMNYFKRAQIGWCEV